MKKIIFIVGTMSNSPKESAEQDLNSPLLRGLPPLFIGIIIWCCLPGLPGFGFLVEEGEFCVGLVRRMYGTVRRMLGLLVGCVVVVVVDVDVYVVYDVVSPALRGGYQGRAVRGGYQGL